MPYPFTIPPCTDLAEPLSREPVISHGVDRWAQYTESVWSSRTSRSGGPEDTWEWSWKLPDLTTSGFPLSPGKTQLVSTVKKAHAGSVLNVRFEMDADGNDPALQKYGLATSPRARRSLDLEDPPAKLRQSYQSEGGVRRTWLSSSSKDTTIRVYDRASYAHLYTLSAHSAPVNGLAVESPGREGQERLVSDSICSPPMQRTPDRVRLLRLVRVVTLALPACPT
jgi:WD40 repeat protein